MTNGRPDSPAGLRSRGVRYLDSPAGLHSSTNRWRSVRCALPAPQFQSRVPCLPLCSLLLVFLGQNRHSLERAQRQAESPRKEIEPMLCAVSLPVTQVCTAPFRRCPSSMFSTPVGLVLWTTRSEVTRLWFITCGGTSWGGGSLSLWERAARQRRVRVQVWANFETLNFS